MALPIERVNACLIIFFCLLVLLAMNAMNCSLPVVSLAVACFIITSRDSRENIMLTRGTFRRLECLEYFLKENARKSGEALREIAECEHGKFVFL